MVEREYTRVRARGSTPSVRVGNEEDGEGKDCSLHPLDLSVSSSSLCLSSSSGWGEAGEHTGASCMSRTVRKGE